jgi:undecaprenyl-diphosphatase
MGALVAAGVGFAAIVPIPDLQEASRHLGQALGPYTYAVVGALAFLETGAGIGLIAPGELAVVIGGVAAGQGHVEIAILIALVWACAFAGDVLSFMLGRRLGREFLVVHGPKIKLTRARLERVERYFSDHGGKTIVVGRFIGLVRAVAPLVAGASSMDPRRFLRYSFVAAGAWSAAFSLLGYMCWQSFDRAAAIAREGTLTVCGLVVLALLAVWAGRRVRRRRGERSGPRAAG